MSCHTNPFNQGYFQSTELYELGFKCVGKNVMIAKNCTIIGLNNISLGNNIRIDGNVVIAAQSGYFELGDYIHIAGGCFFGCVGGILISDFSGVSQGTSIYSGSDDFTGNALTGPTIPSEFRNVKIAPVYFGRHVVVGSGSVVLPGVSIGEGSTVGALSLVTKSLEDWGVYAGSPAKRIKDRSKKILELEQKLNEKNGIAGSS